MSLETIRAFSVPTELVEQTASALDKAGKRGYELFVLWSGVATDKTFEVRTQHVPKQTAYKLETGLCVRVEGAELHRLNKWLYENGETLGVQVHTHPSEAYHSETDDTFPIVTTLGGLSVVVPDFGRCGVFTSDTATYRLGRNGWTRLSSINARSLFRLT
jgi:hypothetical protein